MRETKCGTAHSHTPWPILNHPARLDHLRSIKMEGARTKGRLYEKRHGAGAVPDEEPFRTPYENRQYWSANNSRAPSPGRNTCLVPMDQFSFRALSLLCLPSCLAPCPCHGSSLLV